MPTKGQVMSIAAKTIELSVKGMRRIQGAGL